jgi:hypothetical protein
MALKNQETTQKTKKQLKPKNNYVVRSASLKEDKEKKYIGKTFLIR